MLSEILKKNCHFTNISYIYIYIYILVYQIINISLVSKLIKKNYKPMEIPLPRCP